MAKKTDTAYNAILLFVAATLFISGGWLMASFPIFIFLGLAPLFALTDRVNNTEVIWEKMEWVVLALTVYFLAAHTFDFSFTVSSILYAILFTLPFMGYVWVKQTLGPKAGKFIIILFWLAIEYIVLKIRPHESIFLTDALRLQPEWMRWNIHTGYLGASLWILLTNLLIYQSLLSENPFRWHWIALTVLFMVAPGIYSHLLDVRSITHDEMANLYSGKNTTTNEVTYLAHREFVVRSAAWLSTLVLLFTLVKSQTTK